MGLQIIYEVSCSFVFLDYMLICSVFAVLKFIFPTFQHFLCFDVLVDSQKRPKHVVKNIVNNHMYKSCDRLYTYLLLFLYFTCRCTGQRCLYPFEMSSVTFL